MTQQSDRLNVFSAGGELVISPAADLDETTESGEWIAGSPTEVRQ